MEAPICEIFESIQGEGQFCGVPSTFIRFWGCNLRCRWCDSQYAIKDVDEKHIRELDDVAASIRAFNHKHIVLTGGEPLLYQPFIVELIRKLPDNIFEIETNGTISPNIGLSTAYINLSVKLGGSKQLKPICEKTRVQPEKIALFSAFPNVCFKFVISNIFDMDEAINIHNVFPNVPVYIMPEGIDGETLVQRSKALISQCLRYNFRFSPRLQIMIYGNKRGT